MKDLQETIEQRLAEVDERVGVFLEQLGDQLGVPGSPAERDARFCGYPSAAEMFIARESQLLGWDLEALHDDHQNTGGKREMTEAEIDRRSKVVAAMIDAGASQAELAAYGATVPADEVEQEATVASFYRTIVLEREPVITDIPIPGEHRDASADLADMFLETRAGIRTELPAQDGLPIPNLDPARETNGIELTLEGAPIPGDTIQQSAQLMLEPQQPSRPLAVRLPTKPATEYAGGMPLPDF